jgi:hypothetical protein
MQIQNKWRLTPAFSFKHPIALDTLYDHQLHSNGRLVADTVAQKVVLRAHWQVTGVQNEISGEEQSGKWRLVGIGAQLTCLICNRRTWMNTAKKSASWVVRAVSQLSTSTKVFFQKSNASRECPSQNAKNANCGTQKS